MAVPESTQLGRRPFRVGRQPPREFASTQVNLPPDVGRDLQAFGAQIPDSDLAEDGREDKPHITVKFGLHDDDPAAVRALLAGEGPIRARLGKTSFFPNGESGAGDVLKVDIDSPDLHRLNKKIAAARPTTDTHPTYVPHATIAYLKPGLGQKYAGSDALAGREITIDRIVFSGKDRSKIEIPLTGKPAPPVTEKPANKSSQNLRGKPSQKPAKTPSTLSVEALERLSTDEAMGVRFEDEEPSTFPDGSLAVVCTNCAERIISMVGRGEVYGWEEGTNDSAPVAPNQGHDFAVIDDRWLVDPWAKNVEGTSSRAAFDLRDQGDVAEVRKLYGDPSSWVRRNEDGEWAPGVPTPLRDAIKKPAPPVTPKKPVTPQLAEVPGGGTK